jgi:hypothetical protein
MCEATFLTLSSSDTLSFQQEISPWILPQSENSLKLTLDWYPEYSMFVCVHWFFPLPTVSSKFVVLLSHTRLLPVIPCARYKVSLTTFCLFYSSSEIPNLIVSLFFLPEINIYVLCSPHNPWAIRVPPKDPLRRMSRCIFLHSRVCL